MRFLGLGRVNPGFFVDESSIALNALSIFGSGVDEFGTPYPLYFRAFGEYKNPIFIYSLVPIFSLFEPSIQSTRFAAAFWGVAASSLLTLLSWWQYRNKALSLIILAASLLFPWWFQLSRVAFEVAAFPAILLLSVVLSCVWWQKRQSTSWIGIFLGLSLALLFYTYTAGRMISPLLFFAALFPTWKHTSWKGILFLTIGYIAGFLPLLFSEVWENGALTARYEVVGLSHYTETWWSFVLTAMKQYLLHFSPEFLFLGGDKNLRHVIAPYGVLFWSMLPIILAGMYRSLWQNKTAWNFWCLFGLAISPLPSAFTVDSPHVLRSVGLSVFLMIFFTIGCAVLLQTKRAWMKKIGVFLAVIFCLESIRFLFFAFYQFPTQAAPWFDADTVENIQVAATVRGKYYLDPQLYPGTEATLKFFVLTKQHSLPEIVMRDQARVFVLNKQRCQRMPTSHWESIHQNDGGCVLRRISEPTGVKTQN